MDNVRALGITTEQETHLHVLQTTEHLIHNALHMLLAPPGNSAIGLENLREIPPAIILDVTHTAYAYLDDPQLLVRFLVGRKEDISAYRSPIDRTSILQCWGGCTDEEW